MRWQLRYGDTILKDFVTSSRISKNQAIYYDDWKKFRKIVGHNIHFYDISLELIEIIPELLENENDYELDVY